MSRVLEIHLCLIRFDSLAHETQAETGSRGSADRKTFGGNALFMGLTAQVLPTAVASLSG